MRPRCRYLCRYLPSAAATRLVLVVLVVLVPLLPATWQAASGTQQCSGNEHPCPEHAPRAPSAGAGKCADGAGGLRISVRYPGDGTEVISCQFFVVSELML
jgi:hypothetical protein